MSKQRTSAIMLCVVSVVASAEPTRTQLQGQVVSVADGDTLTLLDRDRVQHRIRIDGIDAPERTQPYSQVSRRSLVELTLDRAAEASCKKRDQYEREVCKVTVDGTDVGLEQVRRGLAWHFTRYAHEQSEVDRKAYAAAEEQARNEKRGLWRDADPKPPWVYRQEQREQIRMWRRCPACANVPGLAEAGAANQGARDHFAPKRGVTSRLSLQLAPACGG